MVRMYPLDAEALGLVDQDWSWVQTSKKRLLVSTIP
jgi:anaerobic selenocysteine-containing dehydrogenase